MDLASLFGPPSVLISTAQMNAIREHFADVEDTVGYSIVNPGSGLAVAAPVRGTRPIPGEADTDISLEAVFDSHGGVYPITADTDEAYQDAINAGLEGNSDLIAAVKLAESFADEGEPEPALN